MKYAKEVIELMGAHAGKRFRVREVVRYVAPAATVRQRASIREGVRRALRALEESGQVGSTRGDVVNGADAEYWWVCRAQYKGGMYSEKGVHNV